MTSLSDGTGYKSHRLRRDLSSRPASPIRLTTCVGENELELPLTPRFWNGFVVFVDERLKRPAKTAITLLMGEEQSYIGKSSAIDRSSLLVGCLPILTV